MTESEFVFSRFIEIKSKFPTQRIALYGIGGHTEYILAHLDDRNSIVGLMDARHAGEYVFGMKVYGIDEIIGTADVIVIIAREAVVRIIFERLKSLPQSKIKILNVNGEDLFDKYSNDGDNAFFTENPYWQITKDELKKAISLHKVVSFDLFDTLLMRRIVRPHAELGFEFEKQLSIPRKDIVECLNYAIELGKRIFILSDMYFSSSQLDELLDINGITGYEEIIVSCEHNATKEVGDLFEVLIEKAGTKNILHVGDNIQADINNAKVYNIDTFYVMSAYDMLLNSPMRDVLIEVPTEADARVIGEFMSIVLNSPFALSEKRGRVAIRDMSAVAAYFTPIIVSFIRWLVAKLNDCSNDTLILFLARDGYIVKQLYDWVNSEFSLTLPNSVYFLASRTAVSDSYAEYRKNYVKYAHDLEVYKYKRILAFEYETHGTTVSKFKDIFGLDFELLCFASFNIDELFSKEFTHSMLGDFSYYDLKLNFMKYFELLEIATIPPRQMQFMYIDNDGSPVFVKAEDGLERDWELVVEFQLELCEQVKRQLKANGLTNSQSLIKTADNILGLISVKYAEAEDRIKSAFIYESPTEGIASTQWWDRLIN